MKTGDQISPPGGYVGGGLRSRKRRELLDATEQGLLEIQVRVRRAKKRSLRGKEKIGLAVGAVLNRHKVGKHFEVEITDAHLTFKRKTEQINAEALLGGIHGDHSIQPDRFAEARLPRPALLRVNGRVLLTRLHRFGLRPRDRSGRMARSIMLPPLS
jgi:hypothetical protein